MNFRAVVSEEKQGFFLQLVVFSSGAAVFHFLYVTNGMSSWYKVDNGTYELQLFTFSPPTVQYNTTHTAYSTYTVYM